MPTTRDSVLKGALRGGDNPDARRFVDLYQPLVRFFLVKAGVHRQDVDDLIQDVLLRVVQNLRTFVHDGEEGAFRRWLRIVTANYVKEWWRRNKCRPTARGGSDFMQMIEQFEDAKSELSDLWDKEHDKQVLQRLLTMVERDFKPQTKDIFYQLVFEEASPTEVASKLGMDVGAVYGAKSRVLHRLRKESKVILDFD